MLVFGVFFILEIRKELSKDNVRRYPEPALRHVCLRLIQLPNQWQLLIAAPAEIPTRMPSFGPIKRAVSNASSLETAATFDKRWCLKLLGQNQRLFLGFYVDLVRHLLKQATPLVLLQQFQCLEKSVSIHGQLL